MKIAIAADHGGYELKNMLAEHLKTSGFEVVDFGTNSACSCDYPDYAVPVARAVAGGVYKFGVLICGTGIGMSLAANKVCGIRCALCGDVFSAHAAREHNDANMLAIGERVTGPGLAQMILDTFVNTEFSNAPRHKERIAKIMAVEV